MRTTCCLNLPPPTIKPPQLPLVVKHEGCWRRECIVMKLACTLIALEMGSLVIAQEITKPLPVPSTSAKWSDKRACPSWRHNSLETVVPENLPRPAARRRYEAVGSKNAPPLSVALPTNANCFSL